VKDGNGDLADSHNILNRLKNYFSQLLTVHEASDVKQIEIHTAEPLVPEPRPFEAEIAVVNLKRIYCKIVIKFQQLTQAAHETVWSEIHKLITYIWKRKNCLISGRIPFLYQFTRSAIKLTVVIIVRYHSNQLHTKCYPVSFSQR
jgi:hypothetical protein